MNPIDGSGFCDAPVRRLSRVAVGCGLALWLGVSGSMAQSDIVNPSATAAAKPMEYVDSRLTPLPQPYSRATVVLDDATLGVFETNLFQVARDDGETLWKIVPMTAAAGDEGVPRAGPMIRTVEGSLILIYSDPTTRKLSWNRETGEPLPDQRADVWAIRSVDGGKTWRDRQEISALFHHVSPYCRSLIQLTQARDGTIVVPLQLRVGNRNRNIVTTVISRDEGRTWEAGRSILDIGGAGVHDGLLEPTLVGLRDGRVWMLLRTNLDVFYESFSSDSGLTWSKPAPTKIDASSSPGFLLRLASGRLMLLWNRLYPEGRNDYPRRTGKGTSEHSASWHRDELSLAFSSDDGRSWSKPVVILRGENLVSYSLAFERRPGEIYLTAQRHGNRSFRFLEADFLPESVPSASAAPSVP